MKKLLAILLVLATFVSLLACGSTQYAHGSEKVVLKLGDHKVTEEIYRYFLLNTMDEMLAKDENCFTGSAREASVAKLEKSVLEDLMQYYAIIDLAKKLGVEMTESEKASLDTAMEELKAECEDEQSYKEELEKVYLSEYVAYSLYCNESLYTMLYEVMSQTGKYFSTEGSDIKKYAKENFVFCRQIVVKDEDDAEGAKEKADQIRERLLNKETPADVLADYEQDETVVGAYYCFAKSEDFAALDEVAVQKMKIGEISAVSEDDYGFHVVIREAADEKYLEENLADSVFESYCMHHLSLELETIMKGYKVSYKDKKEPEQYR